MIRSTVTQSEHPQSQQVERARACSRETLLLVEDEESIRLLTARALSSLGYDVLCVPTGGEALALLEDRGRAVQAMISDVVLPGMDGLELAARARSLRPTIAVLLVSGYAQTALGEGGSMPDYAAFLQKPYRARELHAKVRELLDRLASS